MTESRPWSIEQVVALAPPARFAAAEPLADPGRWLEVGASHRVLWGRCRGSGAEPYDTAVDHVDVAWRCSCPSRVAPCKHALALLVMWVRGLLPEASPPPDAAAWVAERARRAARAAAAAPTDPTGGPGVGAADDTDAPGDLAPVAPDPNTIRDERMLRLRNGLIELDRWLDDRLRTGLADPAVARFETWERLAARLTDAGAGALANRIRRLAAVVGTRPDWHEQVLAEIGALHLLAQGAQRLPELPGPLADAVAIASGWLIRQADVLAGVPETGTWMVCGRSDTREDRIEVRRTWLRSATSDRWAMVLSFAAYRQTLDSSLRPGMVLAADLHRYPGASLRALVGASELIDPGAAGQPTPTTAPIAAACEELGRAFAAEPWLDRLPATVLAAPTVAGRRWMLTDATGSLPLATSTPGLTPLVAASAGEPVVVTVEWTNAGAVPLTVHLPDRALDIGPRADPSFVAAA